MKKHRMLALMLVVALAPSSAQADDPPKSDTDPPRARLDAHANPMAAAMVEANTDFEALRRKIAERSAKVSERSRLDAETKLSASAKEIDVEAGAKGDSRVATRLGGEFGMTAEAIAAQKAALGISWGELTIAHTIAANSQTAVTVEQLWTMKQEGMGWGQIAAGLDLKLGSVVSAVRAESAVARGRVKPDGRVARLAGAGARAGAGAKIDAGIGRGKSGAAVEGGLGVKAGGKLKP